MAFNITVYSNANASSKSISFDFVGDVLCASDEVFDANTSAIQYYYKITTSAKQDNNRAYQVKVVRTLSDLALNKTKQSAVDTANAYANVREMVTDYVYDYINGHTADQFTSGCTEQRPMKFSG